MTREFLYPQFVTTEQLTDDLIATFEEEGDTESEAALEARARSFGPDLPSEPPAPPPTGNVFAHLDPDGPPTTRAPWERG